MCSSKHDSPRYGQHYTTEEVAEIFAPSKDAVDSILEWLLSAGIPAEKISQSVNKQWMQFDASTLELESLLKTEYHAYEHVETGKTSIACEKYNKPHNAIPQLLTECRYHVPAHVQEHVDYITPGIKLFTTKRRSVPDSNKQKRSFNIPPLLKDLGMSLAALLAIPELAVCDIAITPACIKALYNVTAPTKAAAGNELGIFEDLGDVYSQTDLDLFFLSFAQ